VDWQLAIGSAAVSEIYHQVTDSTDLLVCHRIASVKERLVLILVAILTKYILYENDSLCFMTIIQQLPGWKT
jgi:hypothetical protein